MFWSGLMREFDEMLYEANQAGLDYFEREAGYTRSGYHGRRIDGQETGSLRRGPAGVLPVPAAPVPRR